MTKPLFQEADEFVALHPESREIIERFRNLVVEMAHITASYHPRVGEAMLADLKRMGLK